MIIDFSDELTLISVVNGFGYTERSNLGVLTFNDVEISLYFILHDQTLNPSVSDTTLSFLFGKSQTLVVPDNVPPYVIPIDFECGSARRHK